MLSNLNKKMTQFDVAVASFRNEIAQISKLRSSMHMCLDENVEIKSNMEQMEGKLGEVTFKVSNMSMNY